MMVPRQISVHVAAALVLLGASASGQSQSGKVFARYSKPLRSVTLDLTTGTITRGPAVNDRVITTVLDFFNNDLAAFVGLDTGNSACEWIDSASKGQVTGNTSDLMNNVVFAYCSATQDVTSGGVGGSCQLGFYTGGSVGSVGTSIATFNLTGLPGNTANSSINGGFACYFINLQFANLIAFADGPIQYSWQFVDLGTDGILAATFPFLACVDSCNSPGPDSQGMVDLIDQYCPPGAAVPNTFSFGTTANGSYFTSISMDVREATDVEAVATSWNSQLVNVDRLLSGAIVVGQTFQMTVAIGGLPPVVGHTHGAGGPMSVTVRQNCVNGPNAISPIGGRPVEVLISGGIGLKQTSSHNGTTGTFPVVPVPAAAGLVMGQWSAQATILGGGFADLSTARCGVIGTTNLVPDP